MGTLVLLRHGQSQWNLENRFTGWWDVGLSPQGEMEARTAGTLLRHDGLTVDQSQLSPLVNASFLTSDTSAIHLSYNRLFQPPPVELDTSGNSVVVPQRTR